MIPRRRTIQDARTVLESLDTSILGLDQGTFDQAQAAVAEQFAVHDLDRHDPATAKAFLSGFTLGVWVRGESSASAALFARAVCDATVDYRQEPTL